MDKFGKSEFEASASHERYSAKYVRNITDRLASVTKSWQARDFIEYWVGKEVWPIMQRHEEETRNIERKILASKENQ